MFSTEELLGEHALECCIKVDDESGRKEKIDREM
jgi:hypothetical protein